jgi:hypothetical protein
MCSAANLHAEGFPDAEYSRGGGHQTIPLKPLQIGSIAGKDRVQTKS